MNDLGIRSNDKKEKNEIDLYTFIKKILKDIQSATGNVNNFEIYVENNEARIIDIGYVNPNQGANKDNEIFEIEIQGLKTTARKVSFNSQIFKEQSTTIAISAQNTDGKIGIDNTSMMGYNEGLTDRVLLSKAAPLSFNNESTQLSVYNNLSSIFSRLAQFMGGLKGIDGDNSLSLDGMAKYEDALRDLIQYIKQNYNNPNKFKAIIPTKLDLTIDGIGGLIIGNIFKIKEERIPAGYKGTNGIGKKLAFIVTGLGHTIQNNDWTTNINAQTVILDIPNADENKFDYNKILLSNGDNVVLDLVNTQNMGTGVSEIAITTRHFNQNNLLNAIDFFLGEGFTDEQTAAIVGGLLQESKLEPLSLNSNGAFGIAQWLGPRKLNLLTKKNNSNLKVQLQYIMEEFKGSERVAYNKIKSSVTLEQAIVGMAAYERYGGWTSSSTYRNLVLLRETGNRIAYAKDILGRLKNP